jgi:hypothetical protein
MAKQKFIGQWYLANIDPKTYFTDPHNGYLFSKNSWGMRSELGTATFVNPRVFKNLCLKSFGFLLRPKWLIAK